MKKISIIGILLIILILPIVSAQQTADAGVTPDSFLWGLDKALDNLNLLLTFNPTEKARKGIEVARERLEEVKIMVEENKVEAAEKGKDEQIEVLSKVKESISKIKEENATKQIEKEIEIEREIEEHEEEVEEARDSLKIKIEVKGILNEQQKALIESLLSSLENKTAEVKVEIQNKKGKTKIEIKQKTGKSEIEVEREIKEIEGEKGLTDIKKEKAEEEIEDAKESLAELEEELQEHKAEGHVADETPITSLMDNAKKRLANSEEAFAKNDFGNAFGQANAAKQLIKNAERILEKMVEGFKEEEEEHETEEKAEIEIKIEDDKTKVKIEINDIESKFTLDTTDKNAIIQEIAERTGLSIEEVTELAEFEEEAEGKEKKEKESKNKDTEIVILNEKVSLKCDSDEDCLLINKDSGFSCCWAGACDEIDYSLNKYVPVNKKSFIELRKEKCPKGDIWGGGDASEEKIQKDEACGPAPSCPTSIINDNFVAKCVSNTCTKVAR